MMQGVSHTPWRQRRAEGANLQLSVGMLTASIFISLIGATLVIYGRKQTRTPHVVAGAILVIFPYFVHWWWLGVIIAAVVLTVLAVVSKLGY